MSPRKNVKVDDSRHKDLSDRADKAQKSIDYVISKALHAYDKQPELEKKIESLEKTIQTLETQLTDGLTILDDSEALQCYCRLDLDAIFYCARNAPKLTELQSLLICNHCTRRITNAALVDGIPEISYYYACGAKEKIDDKTGETWLRSWQSFCPHKDKWHTLQLCLDADCEQLRQIVRKKA